MPSLFGENLKKTREALGLTQKDLAIEAGVTAASLSAYENQSKSPSLEVAQKISEALNVSLDYLCGNQPKEIRTFSEFVKSFTSCIESGGLQFEYSSFLENGKLIENAEAHGASYFFKVHPALSDFIKDYNNVYNLYRSGTISRKLYDLWITDQIMKNNNIDFEKDVYFDGKGPNF